MSNVHQFISKSTPDNIDIMLEKGNWNGLVGALEGGVSPVLDIRGYPLFAAIMQSHHYHNPSTDGSSVPLTHTLAKFISQSNIPFDVVSGSKDSERQYTAITWAAYYGQWEIVHDFLKRNFQVDTKSYSIWLAIMEGYFERCSIRENEFEHINGKQVAMLALNQDISNNEQCALFKIVGALKSKVFLWPGEKLKTEENAIFSSAIMFHQNALVKAFLINGVSPDVPSTDLLENGVLENISISPAEIAIDVGNIKALELLIEYNCSWGSDYNTKDTANSLLDIAIMNGDIECLNLILNKCPTHRLQYDMPNAMMNAVAQGNVDFVKLLKKFGGSFDGRTPSGYTLLHQAALMGNIEMIKFLVEEKLSWNDMSDSGVTPSDLLRQNNPNLVLKMGLEKKSSNNIRLFSSKR